MIEILLGMSKTLELSPWTLNTTKKNINPENTAAKVAQTEHLGEKDKKIESLNQPRLPYLKT